MAEASLIARQTVEQEEINPVQWAVEQGRRAWTWFSARLQHKECANCGRRAQYHRPSASIFCYCSEQCFAEFSDKADSIRREEPLCCLPGCARLCFRDSSRGLYQFCCKRHLVLFRDQYKPTELFLILKRQNETVHIGQLPKRLRKKRPSKVHSSEPLSTTTATTTTTATEIAKATTNRMVSAGSSEPSLQTTTTTTPTPTTTPTTTLQSRNSDICAQLCANSTTPGSTVQSQAHNHDHSHSDSNSDSDADIPTTSMDGQAGVKPKPGVSVGNNACVKRSPSPLL